MPVAAPAMTLRAALPRKLRRAARLGRDWLRPTRACPVCGGASTRRTAYWRVFEQCVACDFIRAITLDEQESRRGMGLEGSWTGFGGGFREYYLAHMMMDELGLGRVLLFGTGNTTTFAQLCAEGRDVVGCDISQDVIALKQAEFGAARFMPPEALPDGPDFDAVVAVEVIEHLLEPQAVFARLFGLLRPGGVICGTTNLWLGGDIEDGNRPGYMSHLAHVAYWSPRSLERVAAAHGYRVALHEMVCPGSVLPDQRFGQLWPNKRVFFLHDPRVHADYFTNLAARQPILPIDRP